MSDLLQIGSSGLRAYRNALATVSDNVANANTAGFSRRQIELKESPVSSGTSLLYRPQATFGGVMTGAITRAWDQFKSADARLAGGEYGAAAGRLTWVQRTETALNDESSGVGARLTAIFNAADQLSADPNGDFARRNFLSSIDLAAATFRQTADDMEQIADGIEADALAAADLVNADLQTLARLNVQIRKAGVGTATYAQVADERDRLLDEIASKVGIDVAIDDYGAVRITLTGTGGQVLLEDARTGQIGVQRATDGRLGFLVSGPSGSSTFTPISGAFAGLQDAAEQLSGRRQELDGIAADFATALNDWSALGLDRNGVAGVPLLSVVAGAASMQALVTDPDLVPAGDATNANFGNLLSIGTVRTASGAEDRWVALVANHGQAVASAKTNSDVTQARKDIAFTARDVVSGVDLDVEAAELLRYQQAYSACARVIQVARDTMDEIFNIF
ncbi:MAG: flagellar hook-associated protein FlgK [Sphingomonadaceae bacterium]